MQRVRIVITLDLEKTRERSRELPSRDTRECVLLSVRERKNFLKIPSFSTPLRAPRASVSTTAPRLRHSTRKLSRWKEDVADDVLDAKKQKSHFPAGTRTRVSRVSLV